MSTIGVAASVPIARPAEAGALQRFAGIERQLLVRLATFTGLSAFVAWRYAGIEVQPPAGRVVAITAIAVAAAAAISLIRTRGDPSRRTRVRTVLVRVTVLVALLALALLAAGVPVHLLRPSRWGRLADHSRGGLYILSGTLWPYAGESAWARLDVLFALSAIAIAAAALAFWPGQRRSGAGRLVYGFRQLGALALLLTLYVTGVVDGPGRPATVDGILLFGLLAAWLWLPDLRPGRMVTTLAWLVPAGVIAAVLASEFAVGQSWFDYRAWDLLGSPRPEIAFNWDQTYGPLPWSRSRAVMFTVRAATPQLWKLTTLDRFDGLRFMRSGTDAGSYEGDLPTPGNALWYTFDRFSIRGLSSDLVPAEQGTTLGLGFARATRRYSDGTTQTLGRPLDRGDTYTVLSYVPAPTQADLSQAPRAFPAAYLRYTDFDLPAANQSGLHLAAPTRGSRGDVLRDRPVGSPRPGLAPAAAPGIEREILSSPYGPMYRLARRLAAGSHSTYDVVRAIEAYLKTNYTYSEQPPARRYPLESFLFGDRIGYCQQFSGAMALMLRMDGIPARVAAGFLPGTYDRRTGRYEVRALDAHSWVEVFFAGIGWVPFDPTPGRSSRSARALAAFASERGASRSAAGVPPRRLATHGLAVGSGSGTPPVAAVPVAAIAGSVAGGLALIAFLTWLVGWVRLRNSLEGDGELAAAELVRALRRLGYTIPASVTLAQIEQRVRARSGPEAARYVRLLGERRYAAGKGEPASMSDRRRLRLGLTAQLGLDAYLRGLWALPPATVGWRLVTQPDHPGDP